jgi:hypothetical protein
MDLASVLRLQQEQDEDDELLLIGAAAACTLLIGSLTSYEHKVRRRQPHRLYLTRPELLPNPRIGTPWERLWSSQSDRAFITTMGFDVGTFRLLLEGRGRFAEMWDNTPIPRDDTSSHGRPRPWVRSLDAAGALGLVLHYLGSAMLETHLQQIFALIPTTVSRYLSFARKILLTVLRSMKEAAVHLPSTIEQLEADNLLIITRHSLLQGAFGSIDGLSLPVQESDDPEVENATYNGWKCSHFVNNVLVFSPRGMLFLWLYYGTSVLILTRRDNHPCLSQLPWKLARFACRSPHL